MTTFILLVSFLQAAPQSPSVVVQVSTGWCSPNISNSVNITVICKGVSPEAVAHLNQELTNMHLERAEYLDRANTWAERYHRLERSLASTGYDPALSRRAATYLHQGRLDEAERLLKSKTQKERKTNLESAQDNYNLALVTLLKFRPKESLPYLERAYGIDKNNLKYAEEYASLLIEQNDLDTAGPVLRSALTRTTTLAAKDPALDNPDVARLQHLLGLLYSRIPEKWDAAESAYKEALKIYRTLAATDASYQPSVAGDLVNIGNLQRHRQEWSEAEKSFKEALHLYRTLSAGNSGAYAPDAAKMALGMGNLYSEAHQQDRPEEERLDNAEDLYATALEIFTTLATQNPALYLPDKAQAFNNLGSLYENNPEWQKYSAVERWSKSLDCFNQALEIRNTLAASNPEGYKPGVAQTLSSRAGLYGQERRWPLAEEDYKQAIEIRRELAKTNPDEVNPLLAASLEGMATVYRNTNRVTEAADTLEEASGIYRKLAATSPSEYQPVYAGALNNLAILHSGIKENTKAVSEIEAAVDIFRQLAKSNAAAYGDRLGRSLMVDAKIQEAAGKDQATVCSLLKEGVTAAQSPSLAATISVQGQCK